MGLRVRAKEIGFNNSINQEGVGINGATSRLRTGDQKALGRRSNTKRRMRQYLDRIRLGDFYRGKLHKWGKG